MASTLAKNSLYPCGSPPPGGRKSSAPLPRAIKPSTLVPTNTDAFIPSLLIAARLTVNWESVYCAGFRAQRRKDRFRVETRRKLSHVGLHSRVQMVVETEGKHFRHRLVRGPVLLGYAIRGHHHSRAVFSEVAVHEDFLLGIFFEELQKLRHLRVAGRGPAEHRDIDETHTQRFHLPPLGLHRSAISTQIHNRGDAYFLEFGVTFLRGLRSAVQHVADFSGVVQARKLQFLRRRPEGALGAFRLCGRGVDLRETRNCGDAGARGQRAQPNASTEEGTSHHRLDALFYAVASRKCTPGWKFDPHVPSPRVAVRCDAAQKLEERNAIFAGGD